MPRGGKNRSGGEKISRVYFFPPWAILVVRPWLLKIVCQANVVYKQKVLISQLPMDVLVFFFVQYILSLSVYLSKIPTCLSDYY